MIQRICQLLYQHDCVVVPGFGGLIARSESARLDPTGLRLTPPAKALAFNARLTDSDGLLAMSVARERGISLREANEQLVTFVRQAKATLAQTRSLDWPGVGRFSLNVEDRIEFQPAQRANYRADSFGLVPLHSQPIQRTQEELDMKPRPVPGRPPIVRRPPGMKGPMPPQMPARPGGPRPPQGPPQPERKPEEKPEEKPQDKVEQERPAEQPSEQPQRAPEPQPQPPSAEAPAKAPETSSDGGSKTPPPPGKGPKSERPGKPDRRGPEGPKKEKKKSKALFIIIPLLLLGLGVGSLFVLKNQDGQTYASALFGKGGTTSDETIVPADTLEEEEVVLEPEVVDSTAIAKADSLAALEAAAEPVKEEPVVAAKPEKVKPEPKPEKVKPEPAAPAPSMSGAPVRGRYYIIAGAFGDRGNAERFATKTGGTLIPGSSLHKVAVADFASRKEAESKLSSYTSQYGSGIWVLGY